MAPRYVGIGSRRPRRILNARSRDTPDGYLGQASAQYGVVGYPTTILIDRRGNVVGEFGATDSEAIDGVKRQIEKDRKAE